jgi:endonuclease-3
MKLLNSRQINKIFTILSAQNPNPVTELNFRNNFELLVAVILSAQATDKQVNKVTKELFAIAPNAAAMSNLGIFAIENIIKSLGLFKTKAKNLHATSEFLARNYSNSIPNTRSELEKLPGVGRKTANVVLNTAFGELCIAVDTHVFRVANRLGLASGNTPLAVETTLLKRIPKKFIANAHHWLVLHGRYICKARTPTCDICSIKEYCQYIIKK